MQATFNPTILFNLLVGAAGAAGRRNPGPIKKSKISKKSKKKGIKQSRIKNAYRISKSKIRSLIKEYIK